MNAPQKRNISNAVWLMVLGVLVVALLTVTRLRLPSTALDMILIDSDNITQDVRAQRFDALIAEHASALKNWADYSESLAVRDRAVQISSLWMDRCEVTQGDFYRFVSWVARQPPPIMAHLPEQQPRHWQYRSSSHRHRISGRLSAPANGITYYDARGYCHFAGGRLPTAEEWIVAASPNGQLYPWGDEFNSAAWPYLKPRLNAAQKCQTHAYARSRWGVSDMANNVAEWSEGWLTAQNKQPLVHGGDGYRQPAAVHALSMLYQSPSPTSRSPYIGFRCVYDSPPSPAPWRTIPQTQSILSGNYQIGVPEQSIMASVVANLPHSQLAQVSQLVESQQEKEGTSDRLYFNVSACEITRRHYKWFLRDPLVHLKLYADKTEPQGWDYHPHDWQRQLTHPDLPVTGVDWWSARAFARWIGGRLPSAVEWSVIYLRHQLTYPWGNKYDPALAVTGDRKDALPLHCGDMENDRIDGVKDLGGNVSEWTSSITPHHGGYAMVIKGGSYLLPGKDTARIDHNRLAPPSYRSPGVGFRVVIDP